MTRNTLARKLAEYAPANALEQENVLQELMQHHVLATLARSDFFARAVFHGGTCLRIVNSMERFSEDLDFLLKTPDPTFRWTEYLEAVKKECLLEGIAFEVTDKSRPNAAVQKAFLKTSSLSATLILDLPFERRNPRKIKIKLEIDTNPPSGSTSTTSYITYPGVAALTTQTLESGFALKLHALLCRTYTKGRDWFDLVWYVSRQTRPNKALLQSALEQQGPWAGKALEVSASWLRQELERVVKSTDWNTARSDVQRFLPLRRQQDLQLWNTDFFLYQCRQLVGH